MRLHHLLLEFSLSRSSYKDQLLHILIGAIKEFYKAEHAKANNKKTWVVHWTNEYKQLLEIFGDLLLHPVKGCYNKRKAVLEVLQILKADDNRYRRIAQSIVCRDFKQQLTVPIPAKATEHFYTLVEVELATSES